MGTTSPLDRTLSPAYAQTTILRRRNTGVAQARHFHVSLMLWRAPRPRRAHLLHPQHNHGRVQGR
jgi:hypothetical protein